MLVALDQPGPDEGFEVNFGGMRTHTILLQFR
jgi:hypothetical protein